MRAVIVGDTHLRPGGSPRTERFLGLLDAVEASGCGDLYLIGDIFEYWIGPPHAWLRDYRPVLDRLAALDRGGTRAWFIPGNRDFHLDRPTGRRFGVRVVGDDLSVRIAGRRIYLAHGDLYCPDDVGYLRMRAVIRSAPVRLAYRLLPPFLSLGVARAMRRMSSRQVDAKTERELHLSEEMVGRVLRRGFDACVLGHVHRPSVRDLPDGRLLTLGDWDEGASWVEVTDDGDLVLRDGVPPERAGSRDVPDGTRVRRRGSAGPGRA